MKNPFDDPPLDPGDNDSVDRPHSWAFREEQTSPPDVKLNCNVYYHKNNTFHINEGFAGIPANLLINFCCWLVLLLIFTILRKRAWDYGRLALLRRTDKKWTHVFYGGEDDGDGGASLSHGDDESLIQNASIVDPSASGDRGIFSWIRAIFVTKDSQFLAHSGVDAVQYLSFQRHVMVYLCIVCLVALAIIMPLNIGGTLQGNDKYFGQTTISNLKPMSPFLWVHVVLSILLFPLGIYIMRRFSRGIQSSPYQTDDSQASRTLMISHIPRNRCSKQLLEQHFQEAYPDVEVEEVHFAYNVEKLIRLSSERDVAVQARLSAEQYQKTAGKPLYIFPYACGNLCSCCCPCGPICRSSQVNALEFYSEEESQLNPAVEKERLTALEKPLGIAFVTFASMQQAHSVWLDFRGPCDCTCNTNPCPSSIGGQLKITRWVVDFAPSPEDLVWENLSRRNKRWYLKAFLVNTALFLVLLFFTTPAIIINNEYLVKAIIRAFEEVVQPNQFISQFIPTLLLWTMAAVLPLMVVYSDRFLNFWTRSLENHSVMRKTFIFLLFMVVILPSLGLTSAKAFLEWSFQPKNETRWECVFLPDNGAFYVNYVITSALVGTALELVRFPELLLYALRLCCSRSPAELAGVRQAIFYEFPFGINYAWMLTVFATTIIYSISCPIITVFGLLYVSMKHLVDRYNLIFAYGPSKINQRIHYTAINFIIFSIILLQLCLLFFSLLRAGLIGPTIVSGIGLGLSLLLFFSQALSQVFLRPDPSGTSGTMAEESQSECQVGGIHGTYVPRVLHPGGGLYGPTTNATHSQPHASYGNFQTGQALNLDDPSQQDTLYQHYNGTAKVQRRY